MTINILCVVTLGLLCGIGFTLKSRNVAYSIGGALLPVAPLILVVILAIAPEGFLLIDTRYDWTLILIRVVFMGIVIAGLPIIALLGAQYFLRQWPLESFQRL